MPDESIYYLFSTRIPHLRDKLSQRDRLVDSQVYLKVLNREEIRKVVGCEHLCSCATLLLASLLRPHAIQFPLDFHPDPATTPRVFYTFDFGPRRLPPPRGISFHFTVLFAFPIQSKSALAVQLSQFIFCVSADIRSVSTGLRLWDLTLRADRNNVFGALQFETPSRHERIQMEGRFYTNSLTTLHHRRGVIFYHEHSGTHLPADTVDACMQDIDKSLRELTEDGDIYEWQSRAVM